MEQYNLLSTDNKNKMRLDYLVLLFSFLCHCNVS